MLALSFKQQVQTAGPAHCCLSHRSPLPASPAVMSHPFWSHPPHLTLPPSASFFPICLCPSLLLFLHLLDCFLMVLTPRSLSRSQNNNTPYEVGFVCQRPRGASAITHAHTQSHTHIIYSKLNGHGGFFITTVGKTRHR